MKKFTCQASNLDLLTATGVFVMGSGRIGRYLAGFCGVFVLACVSYWIANQANVKYWGLSYALGAPGLMVAWIVTPLVVVFMYIFGTRVPKMANRKLAIIIACATSVCGVSAAIAAAAWCCAKKEDLTLAVGMTLICTVLMMFFMPPGIKWLEMSDVLGAAFFASGYTSPGPAGDVLRHNQACDIDASPLFYTEVENMHELEQGLARMTGGSGEPDESGAKKE